jgi:hypothetical protein
MSLHLHTEVLTGLGRRTQNAQCGRGKRRSGRGAVGVRSALGRGPVGCPEGLVLPGRKHRITPKRLSHRKRAYRKDTDFSYVRREHPETGGRS